MALNKKNNPKGATPRTPRTVISFQPTSEVKGLMDAIKGSNDSYALQTTICNRALREYCPKIISGKIVLEK